MHNLIFFNNIEKNRINMIQYTTIMAYVTLESCFFFVELTQKSISEINHQGAKCMKKTTFIIFGIDQWHFCLGHMSETEIKHS